MKAPQRLLQWRKENYASQAEAADDLDLSQGYLSELERGLAEPSVDVALRIAEKSHGKVAVTLWRRNAQHASKL